ncbi:MAG: aminoacyl-tRNA hydrolase [Anaerolineaceae bacterium]
MNLSIPLQKKEYLIIGLGNPGREFKNTRHNIGFLCIDEIAARQNVKINRVKNNALVGSGLYGQIKITLAKPQTYMNLSGRSVASLIKYFKLPLDHTLIIHDDLDLPLGTIRLRPSGSSGGQKGINSVIQMVGTDQIPRIRVGIGRPPGRMDPVDYVLKKFAAQEESMLVDIIDRVYDACMAMIDMGIDRAMNQFNQSPVDTP